MTTERIEELRASLAEDAVKLAAHVQDLRIALEQSVKLQSHYALLLNQHDGGKRISFDSASAWMARLYEIGTLKQGPAPKP